MYCTFVNALHSHTVHDIQKISDVCAGFRKGLLPSSPPSHQIMWLQFMNQRLLPHYHCKCNYCKLFVYCSSCSKCPDNGPEDQQRIVAIRARYCGNSFDQPPRLGGFGRAAVIRRRAAIFPICPQPGQNDTYLEELWRAKDIHLIWVSCGHWLPSKSRKKRDISFFPHMERIRRGVKYCRDLSAEKTVALNVHENGLHFHVKN